MISVSQLEPVRGKPLYFKTEDNDKNVCMYYDKINKFMELTTSHRFDDDKRWGKLLQKIRTKGSSDRDILTINSRVVSEQNKISEKQIPNDAVYATATNKDKASINEGIFAKSKGIAHIVCMKGMSIRMNLASSSRSTNTHKPNHSILDDNGCFSVSMRE